jgi:hypothetical protein
MAVSTVFPVSTPPHGPKSSGEDDRLPGSLSSEAILDSAPLRPDPRFFHGSDQIVIEIAVMSAFFLVGGKSDRLTFCLLDESVNAHFCSELRVGWLKLI